MMSSHAPNPEEKVLSSKSPDELAKELWDVLIIGGGCVGVGAAIYAYRFNMKTALLSKELGGLITWTHLVENYPGLGAVSGLEMMEKFIAHAKLFDIPLLEGEEVTGIEKADHGFTVKTKQRNYRTKTLIYATGTTVKQLGVPGEERLKSKGVSYCATCDAAFFRNKIVAMVGGGDSACKEALLLAEFATKVYIIARGDKLKPEPINGKRLENTSKIIPLLKTNVVSMEGEQKLTHIILDKPYEGSTTLKLDGVFIAVGHFANTDLVKPLGVLCNAKGEILIDQQSHTNIPGFYAAGDVVQSTYKQAITGVAEGVIAAFSAYTHITNGAINIK